jgi:signal transduction histidine kinase
VGIDGVASPLRNNTGNIVGAALVLRDVTARRRAESDLARQRRMLEELVSRRTADLKALQDELLKKERLATLGHLTATVSHELRNPLGTIRTSMHVLEEQLRDVPQARPLIDRIERNIQRCVGIISELLDFAQVRDLHYERVELDAWLGTVLDELGTPNDLKVERQFGFGAPLDIDTERLRRAITNVFENAVHAMVGADGVAERKLTVRTRAVGNKAELSFSDTGPGMTEEVRVQVFRELFSTKRFGVGLGLPIVKQVLEKHGGEVHVQSTLGAGTRVIMRLPVRSATGDDDGRAA